MSVPDSLIKEFLSPELDGFEIVTERHKPAIVHCLVTSAGQTWRLVMTNPIMLLSEEMAPADIAKRLEQAWALLRIRKHENHELASYGLDFWTRDGLECSVRASECCLERVS